jgi:endonuclease/exonuclease/phosphatase family metal-dependent hydrolase
LILISFKRNVKSHIFTVIYLLIFLCSSAQTNELKVMTFNIRYDNPSDGEYGWDNRKEMVFAVFQNYKPEIICCQEALKGQVDQIREHLTSYKYYGVGREDGKDSGEFSVVFFDSVRFSRKGGSTFWLSETPDIPGSRSWNAACTRIVTWIRLFDKIEKRCLLVFNTHFDHMSELAREESARLLLTRMKEIAGQETVILTGDFNATDTSGAYKILTRADSDYPLNDTRKLAGKSSSGPPYSFIGFPFHPVKDEIIDFIFISRNSDLRVVKSRIVDFHRKDKYPSDHLPVLTQFKYVRKK